jgi:hypothetical protein
MPKMENSINLGLRENLQTEHESDFTNKMGAEPLGFITDQGKEESCQGTLNSWRLDVSNRTADFP